MLLGERAFSSRLLISSLIPGGSRENEMPHFIVHLFPLLPPSRLFVSYFFSLLYFILYLFNVRKMQKFVLIKSIMKIIISQGR